MPVSPESVSKGISSARPTLNLKVGFKNSTDIERIQTSLRATKWFPYIAAVVIFASYLGANSTGDFVCAVIIEIAAFHSLFIWTKRGARGIPIMPVYAGMTFVYYGLPFVTGHPLVLEYNSAEKWFAAATVASVLFIMTVIWAQFDKAIPSREWVIRMLQPKRGAIGILMACLVAAILFNSNLISLVMPIPSALFGVMRAIFLTAGVFSLFALAYLLGAGALLAKQRLLFFTLAGVFLVYQAISLYLISATQNLLVATLGYFLGSGRLPWKLLAMILAALMVLQAGKAEMREKYQQDGGAAYASTTAFGVIEDWFNTGLDSLLHPNALSNRGSVHLVQRASLTQMLLMTQTEAPDTVPFLNGSSYVPIPLLIIPRFFWPDRPDTSSPLRQLNLTYGLLTLEGAESTSIGWGLIAEAYANFGLLGCVGIAVLLGMLMGVAQRSCGRFPVLSARGIAGLLIIISSAFGMELCMAQFVTTLAQSFVALMLLAQAAMHPSRVIL